MFIFLINVVSPFPDLQWELKINRPAFPTQQDFMGSISAILRIQDVYNISARALADGELQDGKSSGGLGADECYELGVVSHSLEYYEDVIDWMREAEQRMRPPYNYSGTLTKIDVLEYLAWAEYKVRVGIVTKQRNILNSIYSEKNSDSFRRVQDQPIVTAMRISMACLFFDKHGKL